jgi:hypothetical protein
VSKEAAKLSLFQELKSYEAFISVKEETDDLNEQVKNVQLGFKRSKKNWRNVSFEIENQLNAAVLGVLKQQLIIN